jgi:acyl-CoA synthetase (AMP-forming)/AMP-acid ligase II
MAVVPALLTALLAHPDFKTDPKLFLEYITISGTAITNEDIHLCRDSGLRSKEAFQIYGMSEGAPVASWRRNDPLLKNGYHAGVGRVLPGADIRICSPDSKEILRHDEIGELHIGGSSVITGYLNGADSHCFYEDAIGNWCITGDQARIDKDGVLYIIGRYKDLIIRGGENISPAHIEHYLNCHPGVVVSKAFQKYG